MKRERKGEAGREGSRGRRKDGGKETEKEGREQRDTQAPTWRPFCFDVMPGVHNTPTHSAGTGRIQGEETV